jgi:CelD/BcsL family acetyltransferase involved in cellulose biosynthesis
MIHIDHITAALEIEALAPEWRALWRRTPNATPFQSPEWLLSWWGCFGNAAPSVVTARDDDRLIGLLPLYLLDEPGCRKLLPFGISLSDYLDGLIDPGYAELGNRLLDSLKGVPAWDECHLPDLPLGAALLAARRPPAFSEDRSDGETCPVLRLPSTVERLREVVPRKTLRYVLRAHRRTACVGDVTVTRAETSTVEPCMGELFRLHERRWQRAGGQGVCADPVVRCFHLTAAARLEDAGMLRLYSLRMGASLAAVYYGFTAKETAYAYLSGFDPDFAELCPGAQIIAHAIEEAVREGVREFHFLRGGEAYKYSWGALDRRNAARTLRHRC